MVVLLWLFAALFMIPNLTGTWGETGFEESTFSCTVLQQPEKERGINPLRVIMAIGISLPLIVIGASYSILLKVRVDMEFLIDGQISSFYPTHHGGKLLILIMRQKLTYSL